MTTTTMTLTDATTQTDGHAPCRTRWARLGGAAFAFFFVKGLLWAIAPVLLWLFR